MEMGVYYPSVGTAAHKRGAERNFDSLIVNGILIKKVEDERESSKVVVNYSKKAGEEIVIHAKDQKLMDEMLNDRLFKGLTETDILERFAVMANNRATTVRTLGVATLYSLPGDGLHASLRVINRPYMPNKITGEKVKETILKALNTRGSGLGLTVDDIAIANEVFGLTADKNYNTLRRNALDYMLKEKYRDDSECTTEEDEDNTGIVVVLSDTEECEQEEDRPKPHQADLPFEFEEEKPASLRTNAWRTDMPLGDIKNDIVTAEEAKRGRTLYFAYDNRLYKGSAGGYEYGEFGEPDVIIVKNIKPIFGAEVTGSGPKQNKVSALKCSATLEGAIYKFVRGV